MFIAFVVPAHYKGLGIGVSVLAYTLGLRHAFDADHISAIDNTTRKVMHDRQGTGKPRPLSFGFFFSLGHSTIVVAMGVGSSSPRRRSSPRCRTATPACSSSAACSAPSSRPRSCSSSAR